MDEWEILRDVSSSSELYTTDLMEYCIENYDTIEAQDAAYAFLCNEEWVVVLDETTISYAPLHILRTPLHFI